MEEPSGEISRQRLAFRLSNKQRFRQKYSGKIDVAEVKEVDWLMLMPSF